MDEQVTAAKTRATSAGFKVVTVKGQQGQDVFQLYDAANEYVCSHTSQDALWTRAFKRGELPA